MQTLAKTHRPTPDLNDEYAPFVRETPKLEPERILTASDLAARFGRSKRTIWLWASNGTLPKPIRVTAHPVYWTESMLAQKFGGDAA